MTFRLFGSMAIFFLILIVVSTPLIKKFGEITKTSVKIKLLCANVVVATLFGILSYILG